MARLYADKNHHGTAVAALCDIRHGHDAFRDDRQRDALRRTIPALESFLSGDRSEATLGTIFNGLGDLEDAEPFGSLRTLVDRLIDDSLTLIDVDEFSKGLSRLEERFRILAASETRRREYSLRFACPCCGFLTIVVQPPGSLGICPVCLWQDDKDQSRDPDRTDGANDISLRRARENFRRIGAARTELRRHVRAPFPAEIPGRW